MEKDIKFFKLVGSFAPAMFVVVFLANFAGLSLMMPYFLMALSIPLFASIFVTLVKSLSFISDKKMDAFGWFLFLFNLISVFAALIFFIG